jgi:Tol biopolymer transport system component
MHIKNRWNRWMDGGDSGRVRKAGVLTIIGLLLFVAAPTSSATSPEEEELHALPEGSLIFKTCPGPDDGSSGCFESDGITQQETGPEIYRLPGGSTSPQRITDNTIAEHRAVLSPSGKKAVVVVPEPRDRESCSIQIVDLDTGLLRELVEANPYSCPWPTDWSSRGWILFETFYDDAPSHGNLYKIRPDGEDLTRLTNFGGSAYISSSTWVGGSILSTKINFMGPSGIVKRDGGGANKEMLQKGYAYDLDISPDGSWFAYTHRPENGARNNELFVMRTDGSAKRRITRTAQSEDEPVWSPNGKMIAFAQRNRHRPDILWIFRIQKGTFSKLPLPEGAEYPSYLTWSPSSRHLAYQSDSIAFVNRVDGSLPRRLTERSHQLQLFAWLR